MTAPVPTLVVRFDADGVVIGTEVAGDPWPDAAGVADALASRWLAVLDERTPSHSFAWDLDGRALLSTVAPADDGSCARVVLTVDIAGLTSTERPGASSGTDRLTGLANRDAIVDRIDSLLRRLDHDPAQTGVAVIRLQYGATDAVVTDAALRLEHSIRAGDVAGRIGPHELAVVFGSPIGETEARVAADRFMTRLGDARVGLAFAAQPEPGEVLLAAARAAVDLAEDAGLHVYVVDEADRAAMEWTRRRVDDLQLALQLGQLDVHYQPVVELTTGAWRSVEALVRWHHPTDGLVGPDDFVPLAERTGLIGQLTEHVLARAMADVAGWQVRGIDLAVAVNVSATDLLGDGFALRVIEQAAAAGVVGQGLRLELTETAVLADVEVAVGTIAALRRASVAVSLDDFGTGASSLAVLRTLPVECLKIDQSFVAGLPDGEGDVAVVSLVIGLARQLGLSVIAEGVETDAQRRILAELGCNYGQGFLFARPMPRAELEARWVDLHS